MTEEKQQQFTADIAEVIEVHERMNRKLVEQGEILQAVDEVNLQIFKQIKNAEWTVMRIKVKFWW